MGAAHVKPLLFVQGEFATPRASEKLALPMWLKKHVRGAFSPFLGHIDVPYIAGSWRPGEDGHEKHVRAINESVTIWMKLRRGDVQILQHVAKE